MLNKQETDVQEGEEGESIRIINMAVPDGGAQIVADLLLPIQSSPILVRLTVDLNLAAEYGNAGGSWGNWPESGENLHSTIRTVMNPKSHCRALRCLHLNVEW